jgi:hypothetical protein
MALPLNVFKTFPFDVPAVGTEIYQAPLGYNAIVLLAQVTNTNSVTQTVSMSFSRNSLGTAIVHDYEVPPKEVLTISGGNAGKLVLETGDKLILSGSSTDLKFLLSLIETLK